MSDARVFVESIGITAPGLPHWNAVIEVLANGQSYVPAEMPRFAPTFLPPNERRRATTSGRIAFQAAEEAVRGTDIPVQDMGAVFASSCGDTEVLDRLCNVLAQPDRAVSPTDFHNSVHNAAAGYWSIATGSRLPSTALSGYDSTFVVGLMEAISTVQTENIPMLLVTYDMLPPPPLLYVRPLLAAFGSALLLTPQRRAGSLASLALGADGGIETTMQDVQLEKLRKGNPAGRALPLLCALARREAGSVGLPYFERVISVELVPC